MYYCESVYNSLCTMYIVRRFQEKDVMTSQKENA